MAHLTFGVVFQRVCLRLDFEGSDRDFESQFGRKIHPIGSAKTRNSCEALKYYDVRLKDGNSTPS